MFQSSKDSFEIFAKLTRETFIFNQSLDIIKYSINLYRFNFLRKLYDKIVHVVYGDGMIFLEICLNDGKVWLYSLL